MVNVPSSFEPLDENEANYQAFRISLVRAATLMASLQAAGDIKEGMRVTELEHLQLEKSDLQDYLRWINNAAKEVLELLELSSDKRMTLLLCTERAREFMLKVGLPSEEDDLKKVRASLVLQGLILGLIKLRSRSVTQTPSPTLANPMAVRDLAKEIIDPDSLVPTDAAIRVILGT